MSIRITSSRLLIDPVSINEYQFIRELVNTEGWLQFIGNRHIYSDPDAITYVQKIKTRHKSRHCLNTFVKTLKLCSLKNFYSFMSASKSHDVSTYLQKLINSYDFFGRCSKKVSDENAKLTSSEVE